MVKYSPDLKASLKQVKPSVQLYVTALEKEVTRLQKRDADNEIKQMAFDQRIKAAVKDASKKTPTVHITIANPVDGLDKEDPDLERKLTDRLFPFGFKPVKI